jgi:hypothetical protein
MSACKLCWFHKGENQIREVDRHSVPRFAISNHLNNIISYKMLMALNSGPLVGVNGSRYKKHEIFMKAHFCFFLKATCQRCNILLCLSALHRHHLDRFQRFGGNWCLHFRVRKERNILYHEDQTNRFPKTSIPIRWTIWRLIPAGNSPYSHCHGDSLNIWN